MSRLVRGGKRVKKKSEMFKGTIWRLTIRLAFPLVLGNFVYFFYSFVDTAFISLIDRQSTAIISGMGLVIPLFILAIALSVGMNMGVSALVARGIGEKNRKVINRASCSGFVVALSVALVVTAVFYPLGKRILHLFAGAAISDEAIEKGWEYLIFILPGFVLLMFQRVLTGVFQGEGLNKYIAVALILSTGFNIVLDPVFIFLLGMGVGGAALATSVSVLLSVLYLLLQFRRGRTRTKLNWNLFQADKKLVKEIVRVGAPHSLGRIGEAVSYMLLNGLVSSIGEASMNSWTLCIRTDQLALVPVWAFSGANLTMVGQNYGKGYLRRVHEIYRTNVLVLAGVVLFFAAVYFGAAPIIFRAFSSLPEVVNGSVRQVRFLSLTFIGVGVTVLTVSTLQATGHPGKGLLLTLLRLGLISVPLAFLLVPVTGWGMKAVFLAIGSTNLAVFVFSWFWGNRVLSRLEHRAVA
jgi:putative MATE family efflux protein